MVRFNGKNFGPQVTRFDDRAKVWMSYYPLDGQGLESPDEELILHFYLRNVWGSGPISADEVFQDFRRRVGSGSYSFAAPDEVTKKLNYFITVITGERDHGLLSLIKISSTEDCAFAVIYSRKFSGPATRLRDDMTDWLRHDLKSDGGVSKEIGQIGFDASWINVLETMGRHDNPGFAPSPPDKAEANTLVPQSREATPEEQAQPTRTPKRIRVGGQMEQAKWIFHPNPEYPPLAKMARIQGTVRLEAILGKDGTVQDLKVLGGHPLLVKAALDAVAQWRYQPTLFNGEPVEVVTEIEVNFSLSEGPGRGQPGAEGSAPQVTKGPAQEQPTRDTAAAEQGKPGQAIEPGAANEAGSPQEMVRHGDDYHLGRNGVKRDDAEAARWYRKAAEQGYAEGQINLGLMYQSGEGVKQDYAEAVSWYPKAAEQGVALAESDLGVMYSKGLGVKRDDAEAVSWYRKAAEQGLAVARVNLGAKYEHGGGVKQDYTEAASWYRKAAEQGSALGQEYLGNMYLKGQGVDQDYVEAVSWYRKAAEQGYAEGQYNLGNMYFKGEGVKQDYAEAVSWYRRAAEQGVAVAQVDLGAMYSNGLGVKQDYAEAVSWCRKAADQGDAIAQYNLGIMYENGRGVKEDLEQARQWFRKAAEQGHDEAKKALDRIGK
jgi:TonB family protein